MPTFEEVSVSDTSCNAQHPERSELRCLSSGDPQAHDTHYSQTFHGPDREIVEWPNSEYIPPEVRREQRKHRERLEKDRIRRMALMVRKERRVSDDGPSRVQHLGECASDH